MIRTKVAALAFGAALGLGTVAATAIPAAASSGSHEVETTVPGGGTTTLTLAGIGDITVTVDATTGAISDVSLATVDGVTLDSQVTLPNGDVQLNVTLADGTQQAVQVSGEMEDGVPAVEAEVEHPEGDDDESEGDESESHESEGDTEDHATPPATGSAPTPGVPSHGDDD